MNLIETFIKNLYLTVVSIFRVLIKSKCYKISHTAQAGEEIVILGNGPSLKETFEESMSFFDGKRKMCVNSFVLSEYFEQLKPEYYVFADPNFFTEKTFSRIIDLREKIIEQLVHRTKWEMTILIPVKSKIFMTLAEQNPNITIKFFNQTKVLGFACFRNCLYRKNIGMPPPQNVLIPAIMLSSIIGYRKIYITGADHSWHENIVLDWDNKLCMYDPHFWNKKDDNVLMPLINPDTNKGFTLKEFFTSIIKVHTSYGLIKQYAQKRGISIFNASKKTYVDTFERIDISKKADL